MELTKIESRFVSKWNGNNSRICL